MSAHTIITVTEMASMPGRYACTHQQQPVGRVYSTTHAGHDPAAAAAYAMSIALQCGGAYTIFGPQRVLDQIPAGMRTRT